MNTDPDISSQALDPQSYYGSLTNAERNIMNGIVQLRGHEDVIRHIEIYVHTSLTKLHSSAEEVAKKISKFRSLTGILEPFDTGEDYKSLASKAIKEKFDLK